MLTTTIDTVRERVGRVAALGDEASTAADTIAAALDDALRVALLDLLSAAAAELTGELEGARVEVRLDGRDARLVVVDEAPPPAPPGPDENSARLTVRLPDDLKDTVTRAAERDGTSVNTWIVRTLTQATTRPATVHGSRLSGYARS